jgi:methionine aminopeptidase
VNRSIHRSVQKEEHRLSPTNPRSREALDGFARDNLGRPHVKVLSDGWTAVTRDRSLSAQFEHTVGVTETGVEVFTRSPKGFDRPPYVQ